jgi:pimeloyl-ACP methyl ester carboxylesterase
MKAALTCNLDRVVFDAAGPVDAPALVLVHGAVLTRKLWLPQLTAFAEEYRVLAPDLPGHGALADQPFRLDSAVRLLGDLIDQHANGRALVVGISLGGYVATALAQRCPQRVSGLVLCGCSVSFRGLLGLYVRAAGLLMRWVLSERWLKQLVEKKVRQMYPASQQVVAQAQIEAGLGTRALAEFFLEAAGTDFRAILRGFPGPVLVLNGEDDRPNQRAARPFAAAARRATVQTLRLAGHACCVDQPAGFTAAIREFARAIGWQGGAAHGANPAPRCVLAE